MKSPLGREAVERGLLKERRHSGESYRVGDLDREIYIKEISSFVKSTKRGKVVGIGRHPAEFWSEGFKNENIGRVLTKLMYNIYDAGKFPTIWKTILLHLHFTVKNCAYLLRLHTLMKLFHQYRLISVEGEYMLRKRFQKETVVP